MATLVVKVRKCICDGCGKEEYGTVYRTVPEYWTDTHSFRRGRRYNFLDLCPKCSENPYPVIQALEAHYARPQPPLFLQLVLRLYKLPVRHMSETDEPACRWLRHRRYAEGKIYGCVAGSSTVKPSAAAALLRSRSDETSTMPPSLTRFSSRAAAS